MDISTRHLRAFTTVADVLNFTRAAESLGVSQPALSATIRQLEGLMGAPLFDRAGRRVRLTKAGMLYLGNARRLLEDMERSTGAIRDFVEKRTGRIDLAALPSAAFELVAPALHRFNADYPHVKLVIRDALNDEVLELVRRGEVDLGFGIVLEPERDLDTAILYRDRFVAAVPAQSALAAAPTVAWSDLGAVPIIHVAKGSNTRSVTDSVLARLGIARTSGVEAQIVSTAIGLVANGLGVAVLSELSCKPFIHMQSVAIRPLVEPEVDRPICMVSRAGRHLSPAAAAFAELLTEGKGRRSADAAS